MWFIYRPRPLEDWESPDSRICSGVISLGGLYVFSLSLFVSFARCWFSETGWKVAAWNSANKRARRISQPRGWGWVSALWVWAWRQLREGWEPLRRTEEGGGRPSATWSILAEMLLGVGKILRLTWHYRGKDSSFGWPLQGTMVWISGRDYWNGVGPILQPAILRFWSLY